MGTGFGVASSAPPYRRISGASNRPWISGPPARARSCNAEAMIDYATRNKSGWKLVLSNVRSISRLARDWSHAGETPDERSRPHKCPICPGS